MSTTDLPTLSALALPKATPSGVAAEASENTHPSSVHGHIDNTTFASFSHVLSSLSSTTTSHKRKAPSSSDGSTSGSQHEAQPGAKKAKITIKIGVGQATSGRSSNTPQTTTNKSSGEVTVVANKINWNVTIGGKKPLLESLGITIAAGSRSTSKPNMSSASTRSIKPSLSNRVSKSTSSRNPKRKGRGSPAPTIKTKSLTPPPADVEPVLYFAYAPDMNSEYLKRFCPSVGTFQPPRIARLQEFESTAYLKDGRVRLSTIWTPPNYDHGTKSYSHAKKPGQIGVIHTMPRQDLQVLQAKIEADPKALVREWGMNKEDGSVEKVFISPVRRQELYKINLGSVLNAANLLYHMDKGIKAAVELSAPEDWSKDMRKVFPDWKVWNPLKMVGFDWDFWA